MSFPGDTPLDQDVARRIAGNLAIPRTVDGLRDFIRSFDPHVPPDTDFDARLEELEEVGFVKNIGAHDSAGEVVSALQGDDEVRTPHSESLDNYTERVDGGRGARWLGLAGELYALTEDGYDALTAPVENEPPPLEGRALEAAEEFNRRLAEDATKMEEEGLREKQGVLEGLLKNIKERLR